MSNLFLIQLGFVCVITYLTVMVINSGYKRFQIRKQRAWNPSNFPVPPVTKQLSAFDVERGISTEPEDNTLVFSFESNTKKSTRRFTYISIAEAKAKYVDDFVQEELAFYERNKNDLNHVASNSERISVLIKRVDKLNKQVIQLLKDSEKPSV